MPKKFIRDLRKARRANNSSQNSGTVTPPPPPRPPKPSMSPDDKDATEVSVQAGAAFEVPVYVLPARGNDARALNRKVSWSFMCEGGDIGFGVVLEDSDGISGDRDEVILVPKTRVDAQEDVNTGSIDVGPEGGTLLLQWDNTFSWFTDKRLVYSIELHQDSATNATPSASRAGTRVVFVLGGPGSGKGTVCGRIIDAFDEFEHLSAGDLLRKERDTPNSKDGELISSYIKEGKIVPVDITVGLIKRAMNASPKGCFLIDGFPRSQDNVDGWNRVIGDAARVEGVLHLECSEKVMRERIRKRAKGSEIKRVDDDEEAMAKRFRVHQTQCVPILSYFEDVMWRVDAEQDADGVFTDVVRLLADNMGVYRTTEAVKRSASALEASGPLKTSSPVRVILGTMTFADQVNHGDALNMLRTFASSSCALANTTGASGRVELDTARMYVHGRTEALLGKVLNEKLTHHGTSDSSPYLRERFYIATKANPFKGYNDNLRPENVIAQLEESLVALGHSSVDLFYLHAPDINTPIEATLQACQTLYEQGRFRELGLSNFAAWEVVYIYQFCKSRGWVRPTVYQGMYNAITRSVEPELFPALRKCGMRFYAYNPLAGGLLTGKHRNINGAPDAGRFANNPKYQRRFWKPAYFEALDSIRSVCDEHGISMVHASIRWLANHSMLDGTANDGIIIGASRMAHLTDNLHAAEGGPLPDAIVEAFDSAWVICKGSAPAYAGVNR